MNPLFIKGFPMIPNKGDYVGVGCIRLNEPYGFSGKNILAMYLPQHVYEINKEFKLKVLGWLQVFD
jgi:hypothetical protein